MPDALATVRERLDASTVAVSDAAIANALNVAQELIDNYVKEAEVPPAILGEALVVVAVEKINIDGAPNGVLNQQFDVGTDSVSTPVRIGRDPMKAALSLLNPFVSGRFFCA